MTIDLNTDLLLKARQVIQGSGSLPPETEYEWKLLLESLLKDYIKDLQFAFPNLKIKSFEDI